MSAFEQAMKINDTPFPFPYAQTVTMMLWFQALMCPMMMVAWLNNTWIVSFFGLSELLRRGQRYGDLNWFRSRELIVSGRV